VNNHLGGYFLCSKFTAELMKKKSGGSILNFASIYGVVAPDFGIYKGTKMTMPAAYSAIKGGIVAFTRYLSTYYAKYNIRANVISPGGVYNHQNASFVAKYKERTPLNRMANPEDIVGAVVFLSSDASSYITGQNIIIDGGWSAW
jgi:NAD(P)-dependent dehydrogenase (short-subunit alcohol dehydrogenase family)